MISAGCPLFRPAIYGQKNAVRQQAYRMTSIPTAVFWNSVKLASLNDSPPIS